jgi:hypothetical protein
MKILIEIECDNDAFSPSPYRELHRILSTVPRKVYEQLTRPNCACDAPESCDKLKDINGNSIGFLKVER